MKSQYSNNRNNYIHDRTVNYTHSGVKTNLRTKDAQEQVSYPTIQDVCSRLKNRGIGYVTPGFAIVV